MRSRPHRGHDHAPGRLWQHCFLGHPYPDRSPYRDGGRLVKEEFVGDAGRLAGIALSTDGRQVIAYLCNGDAQQLSLAEWFKDR